MSGFPSFISFLADGLLIIAALGASFYCMVLGRRLANFASVDKGLGGAIATLALQVEDMKTALNEARAGSNEAAERLSTLLEQASEVSQDLDVMIAAFHDIDQAKPPEAPEAEEPVIMFRHRAAAQGR